MNQEMETRVYRHEGTLILATEDVAPTPIICALVIAAVPGDVQGEMALRWRVQGDPVYAVPTVAKFLQLNPSFGMAVQGILEMMVSGRLDGGRGPQGGSCPHTQSPDGEE